MIELDPKFIILDLLLDFLHTLFGLLDDVLDLMALLVTVAIFDYFVQESQLEDARVLHHLLLGDVGRILQVF